MELRGQSTRHTAFCRLNGVFNTPDCASLISSSDGERKDQRLGRVNTCGAPTAYTTHRVSPKKPQQLMLDILTVTFRPGRKRFTLLEKLSARHRHQRASRLKTHTWFLPPRSVTTTCFYPKPHFKAHTHTSTRTHKAMFADVHSSIIHNSQNMQQSKRPAREGIKQICYLCAVQGPSASNRTNHKSIPQHGRTPKPLRSEGSLTLETTHRVSPRK